ncbi:MAG: tetratricopeptide repeat protein [Acidobacteriota bacterium]
MKIPALSALMVSLLWTVSGGGQWWALGQTKAHAADYNRMLADMTAGRTEEACASAQALAKASPNFGPVYNLLGICATRRQDLETAERLFRKSLELDASFTEARNNLAVNLLSRGKVKEGAEQLAEVVRLAPGNVSARFNLGRIKLQQGDAQAAVEHLSAAHRLRPDDPGVSVALADALLARGQKAEARTLLQSLSAGSPDPQLLFSVGLLAADAGDFTLAKECLGKAAKARAELRGQVLQLSRRTVDRGEYEKAQSLLLAIEAWSSAEAEWNALLGYTSYRLNEPQKALEHLRRAIELAPGVEDYYLKISEFLLFYNSDSAAAAFLKLGLEKLPNSAPLHTSLALTGLARGMDAEMAVRELETALAIDPKYVPAMSLLGVAHLKLKQWDQLLEAGRRLAVAQPQSHEGWYFQGVALAEAATGQGPEAREAEELLTKAVSLAPRFADAHLALGKLYSKLGRSDESIASLRKAVSLNPESADSYYQLSRVLQKAGRIPEARTAMDEYKRLHDLEQEKYGRSLFSVEK